LKNGKKSDDKLVSTLKEKIERSEQFLNTQLEDYVTASEIGSQAPTQFGMMNFSITENDNRRPGYSPNCLF
jgi:hypothetical protein